MAFSLLNWLGNAAGELKHVGHMKNSAFLLICLTLASSHTLARVPCLPHPCLAQSESPTESCAAVAEWVVEGKIADIMPIGFDAQPYGQARFNRPISLSAIDVVKGIVQLTPRKTAIIAADGCRDIDDLDEWVGKRIRLYGRFSKFFAFEKIE